MIFIYLCSPLIYYGTTVLFMIISISKHNMTIYQLNKKKGRKQGCSSLWLPERAWHLSVIYTMLPLRGSSFFIFPLLGVAQTATVRDHSGLHLSSSGLMGTLSRTPMSVFIAHLSRNTISAALQKQQALFLGAIKKRRQWHHMVWIYA